MTGIDVKFSEAMSSIPFLQLQISRSQLATFVYSLEVGVRRLLSLPLAFLFILDDAEQLRVCRSEACEGLWKLTFHTGLFVGRSRTSRPIRGVAVTADLAL